MKVITLLCLCVIVLAAGTGAGAWIYHNTSEEQVSIQEEELEVIGHYKLGAFLSVYKIHDNKDNVTCWTTNTEGISCIPDHMLSP
jgi:flagellar basal body-associated protein FliL